ncbi:MAG: hypothetical protein LBJ67_09605 [Planctomycetaceae bacterium]|nr:hypothetical protein [Planctomycetaceae bacterium]
MANEKPVAVRQYPIAVCRLPIFSHISFSGRRNRDGLSRRLRLFPKHRPQRRVIHHLRGKVSAPSGTEVP